MDVVAGDVVSEDIVTEDIITVDTVTGDIMLSVPHLPLCVPAAAGLWWLVLTPVHM